jgi:hypothetical protein
MRTFAWIGLAGMLSIVVLTATATAGPAEDFAAAYAKAEGASRQSEVMKTQWSVTVSELKAAQSAARDGNYGEAIDHARKAEALANASIAQAKEQETAWKQGVIH